MPTLGFASQSVITNPSYYASIKARARAAQQLSVEEKCKILEALYLEARQLGGFGKHDMLFVPASNYVLM
jgi:hypothetical protein